MEPLPGRTCVLVLSYAQQRWYDPRTGRFLSEDPVFGDLERPNSLQAFGYANGNPLTFVDPEGMLGEGVATKFAKKGLRWLAGKGETVMAHGAKGHAMRRPGSKSFQRLMNTAMQEEARREMIAKFAKSKLLKPNQAKKLVEKTLKGFAPENAVDQGTRYLFQRAFKREIGTQGETVLRVVVDKATGKIITYFPSKVMKTLVAVGALEVLEGAVAEAAEGGAKEVARQNGADNDPMYLDWILPGGVGAAAHEPDMGAIGRLNTKAIAAIEEQSGAPLPAEARSEMQRVIYRAWTGAMPDGDYALDYGCDEEPGRCVEAEDPAP